jgi:sensor domain CHASE-containing protein
MSFDNKDFEKNVKTSLSTIEKLNQALKLDKATEGMLAVEKAIASVSVQPLLNSIENLQQKFNTFGIFGMSVLNRLANSAVDAGKKIWDNTL